MSVAVITGATKGIGKAIAEKLLENGFDIAVCARTKVDLKTLQDEWKVRFPGRQIFIQSVDVGEKEQIKAFAKQVMAVFPCIDILVNNAGIFFPGKMTEEPEGQLEDVMKINFYSAYYLTRALLPFMIKQGSGHIFNMSSIAALKAYPNGGSYSISKYALLGFSENLRYELSNQNIKVTAITPGAVWTNSWKASGVAEDRIMQVADVADMLWAAYNLSSRAVVENMIIRPQLGDL